MNELAGLKDAWGQPNPPSPTAYAAARAALLQQIAGAGAPEPAPTRPRRPGVRRSWLIGGTSVTAAAAAAVAFAVITAAVPTRTPIPTSSAPGRQYSQLSGQQILLAAATVAETRPAGTGTYWHVTESSISSPPNGGTPRPYMWSTWTTHDGTTYVMNQGAAGAVQQPFGHGFGVGGSHLTYQQLEQLPTDPSALKARITDSFINPSGPGSPSLPVISAADMPEAVAGALADLLYLVPVPSAVRAAAFRALASMPDVTNLGTMDGGQALRISADESQNDKVPPDANGLTLVVDPVTSMLLGQTYNHGTDKILTAEWTNDPPNIIQPSTNH